MSSSSRSDYLADGDDCVGAVRPSRSLLGRRVPFSNGMTLIELMIVVAIVGILAAIAYPSYRQQVMRSARTDGKVELMQAAQSLEKCFTMYGAYNNANCAVLPLLAQGIPSEGGKYLVTSVAVQATSYSLQAAPQGAQARDVNCANLTLDSTGQRGRSGTAPTVEECW